MTQGMLKLLKTNKGLSSSEISKVLEDINIILPIDYLELMGLSNGFHGKIGNSYIDIWPLSKIKEINNEYCVEEFAPGLLLIGSDGGGMAYGYDLRDESMPIICTPFIGMLEVKIDCGKNIKEFWNYLLNA